MNTYKITLTPLNRYFFGGDMTFKVEGKKEYNEQYGSYIIRSNRFPQQTSLLGMLRFLILSNDGQAFNREKNKIADKNRAKELIGATSFCVNSSNYQKNDFSCIKQLYPCFLELTDDGKTIPLLPAPDDYGYQIHLDTAHSVSVNLQFSALPIVHGYTPKATKQQYYLGSSQAIPEDELFIEDSRIGINKDYQGITQTDDAGLYKQIFYRLGNEKYEDKLHFACYADITDIDLSNYNGSIVNLGGDNSKFLFKAIPVEKAEPITYNSNYNDNGKTRQTESDVRYKLVLLSDAYLPLPMGENRPWSYAISTIVPFRFISTQIENTENYSILSPKNLRSKKYYLYKKGSVFFCKDDDEKDRLKEVLESASCFRQIGYNYFQILKLNPETNNYETI